MSLFEKLHEDLKAAIRSKDTSRSATLRLLLAAIKNKEIEERKKEVGLGDEEILLVIQKEVKKRKDSITEFEKAGRTDLVGQEAIELKILEAYTPAELPDDEVRRVVTDGIRELGGVNEANFGSLMKIIMPLLKGRASGDRVSRIVKEALGGK